MISAIDSSVLLSVLKGEEDAIYWIDLLVQHAAGGELCICEVVAAEVGAFFSSRGLFEKSLLDLNICLQSTSLTSCYLAGKIFKSYRKEGGTRRHLIPDFLVAAHALEQADLLMANDRGYFRRYFPRLRIIGPGDS